ncbi:helicase SWR1 [Rhizoctonia solani]|uniref:Helicase SWR1 n=1 Tax=Rhizoctonia solani TaxID=456999 RepID=A0A0K6G5C7_9AGAM|nr:helicase SWR1 [Rhizoctonia solani]
MNICNLTPFRVKVEDKDIGQLVPSPQLAATYGEGSPQGTAAPAAYGNIVIDPDLKNSEEGKASLQSKHRKYFTDSNSLLHKDFLTQALKYALQHREAAASASSKAKGKSRARKAEDDENGHRLCISSTAAKKIRGHDAFKGAVLGMYNRSNGIMDRLADLMKRTSRSPMHVWRDMASEDSKCDPYSISVKSSGGILRDLTTQASLELFGVTALTASTRVPRLIYKPFVHTMLERVWERESRRLNTTLRTAVETRNNCKSVLEDVTNKATPLNLREASRALKKYKDLVDITGGEMDESIKKLERSMEDMWASFGYSRDENGQVHRIKAAKKVSMSEEAMDRAYNVYVELHFPSQQEALEEVTDSLASSMNSEYEGNVDLLDGDEGCDIGVAEYAHTSLDEMFRLLGLKATRKIPFTSDELEVQWHQLVAIAIHIKRMFTTNLGEEATPTLLCDHVGLGKTAEIIGTLCMLVHLIELQRRGQPLIPLLAESGHIYFAGGEKIPMLPSVILMPKSLCIQWIFQFTRFTTPGSFRLIDYAKKGGDRISYFAKGGEYDELVVKAGFPQRVVFLCTFPSIGTETGETLCRAPTGAAGREARFRADPPNIFTHNAPDSTIFAHKFLFFSCDELHQLRNATSSQDGAIKLACNSLVRSGATATPVFTGVKDAIAAGAIMRIPAMIGDNGCALGYELLELQRSRTKEWKARQSKELDSESDSASDSGDLQDKDQQNVTKALLKGSDSKGYKVLFIQKPAIEIIRKVLLPYMIRRTSKSRTPEGKLIINVPDHVESVAWVRLKDVEKKALSDLYAQLMNAKANGLQAEMLMIWKAFLVQYKHLLFHHKMHPETHTPLEHFWETWSLENLEQMASSKLLLTLNIIQHYKDYSAQPLFFNRDGSRDLEREANFVPPASPQIPEKPRKILIFIAYDRHTQVTKFVLDLSDIKYLEYNGSKSDVERNRAIKEFETKDDTRVLLLSNVGTTGLNLPMASVVIFLSGMWSGPEGDQMIGRCRRPGQQLVVHVYYIVVPDTADEILAQYATSKSILEEALFVQRKQLATKIFCREDDSDSEDGDADAPHIVASRSAVVARPLKDGKQGIISGSNELVASTNAKTSKKRKTLASSKAAKDTAEEDAGGSKAKRRKVSAKGEGCDTVELQRSSSETGTTGIPIIQVEVASVPPQPQVRPTMHLHSVDQDCTLVTSHLPPAPETQPTTDGALGSPSLVAATSTSSVSTLLAQTPLPVPDHHTADSNPNGDPSISTNNNNEAIPPKARVKPKIRPRPATHDSSPDVVPKVPSTCIQVALEHAPPPTSPLAHTLEHTRNQEVSGSASDKPTLSHDCDLNDDNVGDDESNHAGDEIVAMPLPPQVAPPASNTGTPEGLVSTETDLENQVKHDSRKGDSPLQDFPNGMLRDLGNHSIAPDQPEAQVKVSNLSAGSPLSTPQFPTSTWRLSTTARSTAKLPGPWGTQAGSSASVTSRQCITAADVSSQTQTPQNSPEEEHRSRDQKPTPLSQLLMRKKGEFKDVSKADLPKVLAKSKQVIMEQVDRAAQTGVAKPSHFKKASSVVPVAGTSRQTIQSRDIDSSSKRTRGPLFQFKQKGDQSQ